MATLDLRFNSFHSLFFSLSLLSKWKQIQLPATVTNYSCSDISKNSKSECIMVHKFNEGLKTKTDWQVKLEHSQWVLKSYRLIATTEHVLLRFRSFLQCGLRRVIKKFNFRLQIPGHHVIKGIPQHLEPSSMWRFTVKHTIHRCSNTLSSVPSATQNAPTYIATIKITSNRHVQ